MTPEAIEHLSRTDEILGKLIGQVGPCRLTPKKRTLFQALVRSVVYQQLNGTAAATILGRVKGLYPGNRFPTPEEVLRTPVQKFRAAGLSGAKTAALKDIAEKTIAGVVPKSREIVSMSNEEIIERLTTLRGIGPWSVEMFLIFTLGRPDVLPVTDYGVRKGFAQTYRWKELPTPKELQKLHWNCRVTATVTERLNPRRAANVRPRLPP